MKLTGGRYPVLTGEPMFFLRKADEDMRILIIGAGGPTGRRTVEAALEQGHEVRAFVRNASVFEGIASDRLSVVVGDALRYEDIFAAVEGQDAVVCAIGPRKRTSAAPIDVRVGSIATGHIVKAMEAHGVRRLVVQSAVGVGASRGKAGFVFERVIVPLFLRHEFADKEVQETIVRESALDWVIVQPVRLIDRARDGETCVASTSHVRAATVSRTTVAAFMLEQLTDNRFVRSVPMIGGAA